MEAEIHGVAGCDDGRDTPEYYVRITRLSAADQAALRAVRDAAVQVVGGSDMPSGHPTTVRRRLERRKAASELVPLNQAERERLAELGLERQRLEPNEVGRERQLLAARRDLSPGEERQLELLQRLATREREIELRLWMYSGHQGNNTDDLRAYLQV